MEVKVADVFECPQCGGNWIEEVQTNVVLSSEVAGIETEESELLYGEAAWDGGVVDRYQCSRCGYVLGSARTPEGLVAWLEKNPKGVLKWMK